MRNKDKKQDITEMSDKLQLSKAYAVASGIATAEFLAGFGLSMGFAVNGTIQSPGAAIGVVLTFAFAAVGSGFTLAKNIRKKRQNEQQLQEMMK